MNLSNAWAVYRINVGDVLYYLGRCPLSRLAGVPDFRSSLNGHASPENAFMTVITVCDDEQAALNAFETFRMLLTTPPTVPFAPKPKRGPTGRRVRCLSTGEEFATAADACQAYGINQSNMSAHLAGRHHTAGGQRFEWVTE